ELTGFFECDMDELYNYIHIIGKKETVYLKNLPLEKKEEILEKYFSYPYPFIVVSQDAEMDDVFLKIASEKKKQIFRSPLKTTETVRELKFYLQSKLSQEVILEDYMFMEVYGVGVLITGYQDAKVGVTIELLERGHKIITDDNLIVKKFSMSELRGMNRFNKNLPDSHFFLLNKDNTKIDITTHFGIKGTRTSKRIDLIINLEKWNEKKFYDRLGLDDVYEKILDVPITSVTLPVRKGRNLAVIVEAAAMNHRLKKLGVNSAEYFWKESKRIIMENTRKKERQGLDMRKRLPLEEFINHFSLEVVSGESFVQDKDIVTTGIHRPSLALSGYFDMYDEEGYNGVQIFSEIEFNFLEKLPLEQRIDNLEKYLNYNFPVLILTRDAEIPKYFYDIIEEKKNSSLP
ncbi:MAG: serine kinase, partial [Fusobacteriaceae bacterium]